MIFRRTRATSNEFVYTPQKLCSLESIRNGSTKILVLTGMAGPRKMVSVKKGGKRSLTLQPNATTYLPERREKIVSTLALELDGILSWKWNSERIIDFQTLFCNTPDSLLARKIFTPALMKKSDCGIRSHLASLSLIPMLRLHDTQPGRARTIIQSNIIGCFQNLSCTENCAKLYILYANGRTAEFYYPTIQICMNLDQPTKLLPQFLWGKTRTKKSCQNIFWKLTPKRLRSFQSMQ